MLKTVLKLLALAAVVVVTLGIATWRFAPKDHTHTAQELYTTLADGKYDTTFLMSELALTNQDDALTWTRPLLVRFIDANGEVLGGLYGMGILCGDYVISRATLLDPRRGGVTPGVVVEETNIRLLPNPTVEDDWMVEDLDVVYSDLQFDFVLLERPTSLLIQRPEEGCGVRVGNFDELSPGDVLFQAGHFPIGVISVDRGVVTYVDKEQDFFYFQGTVEFTEIGGPVFALRDGKLELVGMTVGSFTNYGIETKAAAVSMETILKVIKSATDIDLSQDPQPEPD